MLLSFPKITKVPPINSTIHTPPFNPFTSPFTTLHPLLHLEYYSINVQGLKLLVSNL